jgi:hypothetical protein
MVAMRPPTDTTTPANVTNIQNRFELSMA